MGYTVALAPMPKEKPLLKIKVKGPAIKPGRIPVPLLVTICEEMQKAITREAEALEGRRSLRRGPPKKPVVDECTLELVSIKKGSTTLNFVPLTDQKTLPGVEGRRTEAIDGVAAALKSFSRERGNPPEVPEGIIDAFDKLGEVLDRGVDELRLIVADRNGNKRDIVADLIPAVRLRIKSQLQRKLEAKLLPQIPLVKEGLLEVTEGKARLTPAVGAPTVFSFDREQADNVFLASHRPAKANLDPKTRNLKGLEITALAGGSDFFASKTIDELIAQQGIQPVEDLSVFATLPDAEVDSLIAEIHRGREA